MLTDAQDMILAEFVADENGGEPEEYLGQSETTRDAFDQFDGRNWSDWKGQEYSEQGGYPAVYYRAVQARRGQPRAQLWVVDFGDVRGIYQG